MPPNIKGEKCMIIGDAVTKEPSRIVTMLRELLQNMTQEVLAQKVGVTVSTVNRWVNMHSEPSKLAVNAIQNIYEQNQNAA